MPMLTTARIRSPVCPVHAPLRTRSAKSAIRSSTSWTSCRTSCPSTSSPLVARVAQRDVQDGAVLGGVDVLAAEHRLGALAQPGALGQRHEQPDRLAGQPVLRVVEVQVAGPAGQLLAAARGPRRTGPAGGRSPTSRWCSASACHSALSLMPTPTPPARCRRATLSQDAAATTPGRSGGNAEPRARDHRRLQRPAADDEQVAVGQLLPAAAPAAGGDDDRVRR